MNKEQILEYFEELESKLFSLSEDLEINLFVDDGENCCCDPYGDVWINPTFIQEYATANSLPHVQVLNIVLAHEIGHAMQIIAGFTGDNEVAAWSLGEALYKKLWGNVSSYFNSVKDNLLASYASDSCYEQWLEESEELHQEAVKVLTKAS